MAGKLKSKRSPALQPRLRIACGDEIALGPGKIKLLELIEKTGSIGEAARHMEMSYMRAWKLIQTMNGCFKEPLVLSARGGKTGGGAELTNTGRKVLALYQKMECDCQRASESSWKKLQRLLQT